MANEVNRRNFADEEEHRHGKKNEHQLDNTMDDNSGYLIRFQGGSVSETSAQEEKERRMKEKEGKEVDIRVAREESWIN